MTTAITTQENADTRLLMYAVAGILAGVQFAAIAAGRRVAVMDWDAVKRKSLETPKPPPIDMRKVRVVTGVTEVTMDTSARRRLPWSV